jgi:hypothetical protein
MTTPDPQELTTTKDAVTAITTPVLTDANYLAITDQVSYSTGDLQLLRIRDTRKLVNEKLDPIIRPIYDWLQSWYSLKRELSDPLDIAEQGLKQKMSTFQFELLKKKQESQRLIDEETRRLSQQAQAELTKSHDTGLSAIERARAKVKAQQTVTQAKEVAQTTTVAPVRAANSSVIPTTIWEVTDFKAFLKGIVDGTIPEEMVTVQSVNMNAMWKMNKEKVKGWPGVGAVEGVRIVGR